MRTPLTYYGGKQQLAARIVALMPPHKVYFEPFAGGAAVLFAKPRAQRETLNDVDCRVMRFWRAGADDAGLNYVVGPQGSGKSMFGVREIVSTLRRGQYVVTNVRLFPAGESDACIEGWAAAVCRKYFPRCWRNETRRAKRIAWLEGFYIFERALSVASTYRPPCAKCGRRVLSARADTSRSSCETTGAEAIAARCAPRQTPSRSGRSPRPATSRSSCPISPSLTLQASRRGRSRPATVSRSSYPRWETSPHVMRAVTRCRRRQPRHAQGLLEVPT